MAKKNETPTPCSACTADRCLEQPDPECACECHGEANTNLIPAEVSVPILMRTYGISKEAAIRATEILLTTGCIA